MLVGSEAQRVSTTDHHQRDVLENEVSVARHGS